MKDEPAKDESTKNEPARDNPALLDWRLLQRVAYGRLGLLPATFWSLTPVELRAYLLALRGDGPGDAPPTRAELQEMHARYPDQGTSIAEPL